MTDTMLRVYAECMIIVREKEGRPLPTLLRDKGPTKWNLDGIIGSKFMNIYFSSTEVKGRMVAKDEHISSKSVTKTFKKLCDTGLVRRKKPGSFAWFLTEKGSEPMRMAEALSDD